MKFIVSIILTSLLSFLGGLYLPWWSIAIGAFIVALTIYQGSGKAFLSGFLGIFILWLALAWWINIKNESILAKKIALIFPFGGSSFLLILVTALIGAIVGGFAAMSGSYLRSNK